MTDLTPRKYITKKQRVIQLTDMHIPFHDRRSLEAVFKFMEDFKPHQIVLTGDILDFYKLSRFDKDPARLTTIQDEIDMAYPILKKLKDKAKYKALRKYYNTEALVVQWIGRNFAEVVM